MEENRKGFFEDNEGIFLISSNYMEKQQIEDGLNRETERISTVGDLIRAFTDLTTSEGIRASVIITSEIPTEIRKSLEDVRDVLEVSSIPVFEIGVGEVVEGAYRFGTINDFLVFVRGNRRKARISEVKDKEQRDILQELQLESEARLERIQQLEQEVTTYEERIEEVEGKYDTLKTEVEQVYEVQRDTAVEESKRIEKELGNVTRLYDVEKKKSEQYRLEKDAAIGELTELRLNLTSLENVIGEKQGEIKKLEAKVKEQHTRIQSIMREKDNILTSKVDAEELVILNKELDKERLRIDELEEEITELEVKNRQVKYEKELIEKEKELLQDGEMELQDLGRTMKLDTYKFNRVNLIYIKVFEWMPYMRLAIEMFFNKLSENVQGRSHLMLMRYDDGMDAEYFRGIPLWSKLRDVPASDRIFRMFPNHVMFQRVSEWEKHVELLVVVDNIKNNQYYLESRAREKYMTVVRRSTDMKQYDLKGSAITIDGESIYDITEDDTIKNSSLEINRRRLLEVKVSRWVDEVWENIN